MRADMVALDLDRRVERLIEPWTQPGSPGVTVAVLDGDRVVARRHAGLASIELGVPIGDDTTFRVASVTKQFTCFAALLLAAEGRLDVTRDIRTYVPSVPDLGAVVTVDHLMRNTSGLRDIFEIMRLGGLDLTQPCGVDDFDRAIARQRGLNFPPGTRFLYSNTNFILLGQIVAEIAGMPLGHFLDQRIFAPLGMNATRLAAGTDEVAPGLATGYLARAGAPGGFVRAQHGFPLGGEGGLVSSIEDLALWHRNFRTARVGGRAVVDALTTSIPFANGHHNFYSCGLESKPWRGLDAIGHGGLWPGYKTQVLRVPQRDLTVLCIANVDTVDAYALAHQLIDAALVDAPEVPPAPALPARAELDRMAGRYLDRSGGWSLDVTVDQQGRPSCVVNGAPVALLPTIDGRLAAHRGIAPLALRLSADGRSLDAELDAGTRVTLARLGGEAALPGDLAGHYENADMAARWTITQTESTTDLTIEGPHATARGWSIEPLDGDSFRVLPASNWLRLSLDANLVRDDAGRPTGLRVSGGRVKNVFFTRIAGPATS